MNTNYPVSALSVEQRFAFHKYKQRKNIFITGPGGVGKSQLLRTIVEDAKSRNIEYAVCALTGSASVLLQMKARTIHSWSGIKLANGTREKIWNDVRFNKTAIKNWKTTQLLIIDEVSMMSLKIFEILENIGRIARGCDHLPFGGIQVIFTGDFYQLPPVGDGNDIETSKFCFESEMWAKVFPLRSHIQLETMFRQSDPIYKEILNRIRIGEITKEDETILYNRVGLLNTDNKTIPKLFPNKRKVNAINTYNYDLLEENEYVFTMLTNTELTKYINNDSTFNDEELSACRSLLKKEKELIAEKFRNDVPVDEKFVIKKGTVVMLTYNLSVETGLCNGSTGKVVDFIPPSFETISELRKIWITGEPMVTWIPLVQFTGMSRPIPIIPQIWQHSLYPCIGVIQYPLIHCWAMTIHKIQGASLDCAEIDIGNSIFEYGQTYVALSRIRSLEGVYLLSFQSNKIKANPKVKLFYKQMLPIQNIMERDHYIDIQQYPVLDVETPIIVVDDVIIEEEKDENSIIPIVVAEPIIENTNTNTNIFTSFAYRS